MRESEIEHYLVNRAAELGGHAYKWTSPGRRGVPDRIVMLPGGRLHLVELKATGVKPDPHQVREHARMRAMGQRVEVIDSIEGVEELLA